MGAAVVGGAAAAWVWPAPLPLVPSLAERLGVPCRLPRARGVALTFDDGPHPQGTPAVLEALADARALATFYLVGEQVVRWPALAGEIAAAGHEIESTAVSPSVAVPGILITLPHRSISP